MGHRHTKDDLLAGALAVAHRSGLSSLTFGRVGKELGISDRTVVYYFPTKDQLVAEVVLAVGLQLQEVLDAAVPDMVADHLQLARRAWPALARPDGDQAFALFFEANGLATAGRAPYDELVPALVTAFVDWAESRIDEASRHRRAEAEAASALIDGLVLLRLLGGPDAADRAARRLGVR